MTTTFKRIAQPVDVVMAIAELDAIVQKHTAFGKFAELTDSTHPTYRPTIFCDHPDRVRLADAYDFTMIQRGDSRRTYRAGLTRTPRRRSRKVTR